MLFVQWCDSVSEWVCTHGCLWLRGALLRSGVEVVWRWRWCVGCVKAVVEDVALRMRTMRCCAEDGVDVEDAVLGMRCWGGRGAADRHLLRPSDGVHSDGPAQD